MNELESFLAGDGLYWLLGIAIPVLLVLVFFVISRMGRTRPEGVEPPPAHLPPREHDVDAVAERLSAKPVPSNVVIPALEERESGVPADDVPPDLGAREQGGLPQDESVRPHTVGEIQKEAPRPLSSALVNTRSGFLGRIKTLFSAKPTLSASELEELEEILYTSDLGPQTVQRLLDAVESRTKADGGSGFEAVRAALKSEMIDIFATVENGAANSSRNGKAEAIHHGSEEYIEGLEHLDVWTHKPAVLLVVGVNGAGKTTTIGKLASRVAQSGRRVLVAAGDTFRAAAGDQLKVWTERARVEIFSPENVTDPSAVAFMACEAAEKSGFDLVIIDTAGRLHTQKNLMEELKKMKRVIMKQMPAAPHEVLLVLDANSGQNALIQAREFHQALEISGVVLTKMDGTAKGGVAIGLACELNLPIKLIGVGEGINDLRRFSSQEFVDSIL